MMNVWPWALRGRGDTPAQQNRYVARELPPARQHFMSGASSSSQQAVTNKDIVRAWLGYIER